MSGFPYMVNTALPPIPPGVLTLLTQCQCTELLSNDCVYAEGARGEMCKYFLFMSSIISMTDRTHAMLGIRPGICYISTMVS